MRSILTDMPTLIADDTAAVAVTLRAITPKLTILADAERVLLVEWLDRTGDSPSTPVPPVAPAETAH